MSNSVVWVDIPVLDLDRAIAFYSHVLGKKVSRVGGEGFTFGLFEHSSGKDVGACVVTTPDNKPSVEGPLVYLNAEGRLSKAKELVETAGGKLLTEIQDMGPHGSRIVILDSEGNRVALHSMSKQ